MLEESSNVKTKKRLNNVMTLVIHQHFSHIHFLNIIIRDTIVHKNILKIRNLFRNFLKFITISQYQV